MYRRYAFIGGTAAVALLSLLANLGAAQAGGVLAPLFLAAAVASPVLIVTGGWKLGKDWLGIEPPR